LRGVLLHLDSFHGLSAVAKVIGEIKAHLTAARQNHTPARGFSPVRRRIVIQIGYSEKAGQQAPFCVIIIAWSSISPGVGACCLTKDGLMDTRNDSIEMLANVRSFLLVAFGILTICALVFVVVRRFASSDSAAVILFWVHYTAVRVLLSGLMVYSGINSSGKNPDALFGLNIGIGLSSLFMSLMNVLEYSLADGDWKDAAAAVLYLPVGLAVVIITLYLRRRKQSGGGEPADG
jgi:hypothetical protein